MAFLSLMVIADARRAVSAETDGSNGSNWPKVSLVLAALVLYGLLLERLGFVPTTFVLLSFLLRIGGEVKWPTALVVACVAVLSSFALFDLWLRIRLPKGMFGF
jgi:hypothetical protein